MKAVWAIVILLLAIPGRAHQGWEHPRREHVLYRFDPTRPGNLPVAGLTPPWIDGSKRDDDNVVTEFSFLIQGPTSGSFFMGTPVGILRVDSQKGMGDQAGGMLGVSTLYSRSGRFATYRDSQGHSYFTVLQHENSGQAFYRGGDFGNPITADERYLLAIDPKKRRMEWLPINSSDATWIEAKEEAESLASTPQQKLLARLRIASGVKTKRLISARYAELPPGLRVLGVEAGEDSESPWMLGEAENPKRVELWRWDGRSRSWRLFHTIGGDGQVTAFTRLSDGSLAIAWRQDDGMDGWLSTVLWVDKTGTRLLPIHCGQEAIGLAGGPDELGILTRSGLEVWQTRRLKKIRDYRVSCLSSVVFDPTNRCFLAARSWAPWLRQEVHLWDINKRSIRAVKSPGPTMGEWHYFFSPMGHPLAISQDSPDRIVCVDLLTGAEVWNRSLRRGRRLVTVDSSGRTYLLASVDGSGEVREVASGGLAWKIPALKKGAKMDSPLEVIGRDPLRIARISTETVQPSGDEQSLAEVWDGLTGTRVLQLHLDERIYSINPGPRQGTWLITGFDDGDAGRTVQILSNEGKALWHLEGVKETWLPYAEIKTPWPKTAFISPEHLWVDPNLPKGMGLEPSTMRLEKAQHPFIPNDLGNDYFEYAIDPLADVLAYRRFANYWSPGPFWLGFRSLDGRLLMEREFPRYSDWISWSKTGMALSTNIQAQQNRGMNCFDFDPVSPWIPPMDH